MSAGPPPDAGGAGPSRGSRGARCERGARRPVTLREAHIRERFGVTVVAIARADGARSLNPPADADRCGPATACASSALPAQISTRWPWRPAACSDPRSPMIGGLRHRCSPPRDRQSGGSGPGQHGGVGRPAPRATMSRSFVLGLVAVWAVAAALALTISRRAWERPTWSRRARSPSAPRPSGRWRNGRRSSARWRGSAAARSPPASPTPGSLSPAGPRMHDNPVVPLLLGDQPGSSAPPAWRARRRGGSGSPACSASCSSA